jgi:hypothetical protein
MVRPATSPWWNLWIKRLTALALGGGAKQRKVR